MVLERHNGQHRRVARCPDSHGLSRREHRGSLDQPVAVDASVLGIATIMRLAGAPTIQDNVISRLELGMSRAFHRACEINAGHHGPAAHNRSLASQRQTILVVEGGVRDLNQDVAGHQVRITELCPVSFLPLWTLAQHQGLELHGILLHLSPGSLKHGWQAATAPKGVRRVAYLPGSGSDRMVAICNRILPSRSSSSTQYWRRNSGTSIGT